MEPLIFDSERAQRYRKSTLILAYQSASPFKFHKTWGLQDMPAGSWVAVPLDGQTPKRDIYGIEQQVFEDTYEPVAPNIYRKVGAIEAYQPGHPFTFETETHAGTEVANGQGRADDWFVRNPDGENYRVSDHEFRRMYQPA